MGTIINSFTKYYSENKKTLDKSARSKLEDLIFRAYLSNHRNTPRFRYWLAQAKTYYEESLPDNYKDQNIKAYMESDEPYFFIVTERWRYTYKRIFLDYILVMLILAFIAYYSVLLPLKKIAGYSQYLYDKFEIGLVLLVGVMALILIIALFQTRFPRYQESKKITKKYLKKKYGITPTKKIYY